MLRPHRSPAIAVAGAVVFVFVISTKCAYAYIDPGTGSYVLQVLAASILAGVFVIKCKWQSIRDAVARMCKRKADGQ